MRKTRKTKQNRFGRRLLFKLSAYGGLGASIITVIVTAAGLISYVLIMPILLISFIALAVGGIGQYKYS